MGEDSAVSGQQPRVKGVLPRQVGSQAGHVPTHHERVKMRRKSPGKSLQLWQCGQVELVRQEGGREARGKLGCS